MAIELAPMTFHGLKLQAGHDVLGEIERFVERLGLTSAVVISAVGSLNVASIRFAVPDGEVPRVVAIEDNLEIITVSGGSAER